jgi:hypothetical protein
MSETTARDRTVTRNARRDGPAPVVNELTRRYLEECGSPLPGTPVGYHLPEFYGRSYGNSLLRRPMFIPHHEMAEFAADLTGLFALLKALPERCYDGDLRRYGAALGMDERLADLMTIGATGSPQLYARADAYHDGASLKLLELNVGSELGGVDAAQLNRAYLGNDEFREFAARNHLQYVDTAAVLAEALRRSGRSVTSREPVVGLIEGKGGLAEHEHVFVAIREAMERHGVQLLLGEIDKLSCRNGKVTLDGVALDVVLRYFSTGQVLDDPSGRAQLEMITRAHAAEKTALFTPLEGAFLASKGSLGMLHEPAVRRMCSAGELAVVDRVVPWTRVLSGRSESVGSAEWDALVEHSTAHREQLILKPGIGYGGAGAVVGRDVSDTVWLDALTEAREGDFVVQQIVLPESEPVFDPEKGVVEDWRANWGVFVTEEGYGGAFVRALKAADGSVISYSNPGTRGTCVFTSPAVR